MTVSNELIARVAPAAMDMVSGQVQLVTGTIPALLPLVKDGRIKPLAVTSAKRSSAMPDSRALMC